jgi:small-conductance mechanosensitive channel
MFKGVCEIVAENMSTYILQATVAAVVIIIVYLLNRLVLRKTIERFASTAELDPHYTAMIERFGSIVLYLVAVSIILANLGVTGVLYGLLASAGFAGIVVGMAAREVLADLLGGIVLMADRPFKVGDPVVIDGTSGKIEAISFRSVTLRAWTGEKVVMPNSKVSGSTIKNFDMPHQRADILLPVEARADIRKVIRICKDLLTGSPDVLKEPGPTLLVGDFKDTGVELTLLFWIPTPKFFQVTTEIRQEILERLTGEGISIALPHIRVLNSDR